MKYNPAIHHRRSIRLKGYDYGKADFFYFITICTHDRQRIFGEIRNGNMILNESGKIANQCWLDIPKHYPYVVIHQFVIMPDHVHGILEITQRTNDHVNNNGDGNIGANYNSPLYSHNDNSPPFFHHDNSHPHSPSGTIGAIVRGYKIGVTNWMRQNTRVQNVWQRNYYVHIITNQRAFYVISQYIKMNPEKWKRDHDHPF
jgi:putative transposase